MTRDELIDGIVFDVGVARQARKDISGEIAEIIITRFEEAGIPITALLSGDMVAVPVVKVKQPCCFDIPGSGRNRGIDNPCFKCAAAGESE